MTETTPRREATRQRLVVAAIAEFAAHGIGATSVEQLCEAAGFTRGAFYSNFATKDDLCIAILEHHHDVVLAGLEAAFSAPPEGARVDWATGAALSEFFAIIAPTEDFGVTLLEIRLRALRSPELAARVESISASLRPDLIQFLERMADRFRVRLRMPTSDLIDVLEGMYFQLGARGVRSTERLIAPLIRAISDPLDAGAGHV